MVVENQYSRRSAGEKLFQAQHLSSITKRVAREQPELGQGIEDHTCRLHAIGALENALCQIAELDLCRVIEGVLFRSAIWNGRQLIRVDAVERPSVGRGYSAKLLCCLGEC